MRRQGRAGVGEERGRLERVDRHYGGRSGLVQPRPDKVEGRLLVNLRRRELERKGRRRRTPATRRVTSASSSAASSCPARLRRGAGATRAWSGRAVSDRVKRSSEHLRSRALVAPAAARAPRVGMPRPLRGRGEISCEEGLEHVGPRARISSDSVMRPCCAESAFAVTGRAWDSSRGYPWSRNQGAPRGLGGATV